MMRGIVHCVALAVAAVTMAVCSSDGVLAASAVPVLQAAHQAAAPPAEVGPGKAHGTVSPAKPIAQGTIRGTAPPATADPDEAHGKVSPAKSAAPVAHQAVAPPANVAPGEAHGKASPAKSATPAAHQAAAPLAEVAPAEAHGKVPPANPATPAAHQAVAPPTAVGHESASAKPADDGVKKGPAADPVANATEAVERINRLMAEHAPTRTRPPVAKTGSAAVHADKAPLAAKVRPRPLLTWDSSLVSHGVALVWDNDLVPRFGSTGRDLGVRMTWPR